MSVYSDQCVFHTTHVFHMHITQRGISALMKAAMEGETAVVVELEGLANVNMRNTVCTYNT